MPARTVLIATPSEALSGALSRMLAEAGQQPVVMGAGEDLAVHAHAGDCVLIDWDGGEEAALRLMAGLRDRGDYSPVILLAGAGAMRQALRGLREGASDLLEAPPRADELLEAIEQAIIRAARSSRLMRDIERARRLLTILSGREQQIVAGIVAGRTSRQIAREAAMSVRTVETSRTRLLGKLGVPNTAALVRLAVLGGLGPDTPPSAPADA